MAKILAEAKYPHYNGNNGFLFANPIKIYQFKAKNSEIKDYILCLCNASKDFKSNNIYIKKKQY